VQTILPMSGGSALKITTARYYTPNGRSIQATGILPDVVTEEAKVTKRDKASEDMLKEADLPGHIEGKGKGKEKPGAKKDVPSVKLETAGEDYQLQEALNLLKGISIFRTQKP
jgi:carboxyl-terminal processing protease